MNASGEKEKISMLCSNQLEKYRVGSQSSWLLTETKYTGKGEK